MALKQVFIKRQYDGPLGQFQNDLETSLTGLQETSAAYHPADPTKWSGKPPTSLAEALDRIAAALGPIA